MLYPVLEGCLADHRGSRLHQLEKQGVSKQAWQIQDLLSKVSSSVSSAQSPARLYILITDAWRKIYPDFVQAARSKG